MDVQPSLDIAYVHLAEDWAADCERVASDAVAAAYGAGALRACAGAELSIVFADDAVVRDLNREWRGKDAPTNVLTFPAAGASEIEQAALLGDIVLARETIVAEAAAEAKPFQHHLAHLVVHGVLHLYGYDHQTGAEAERMENLERAALARLGIADPYRLPADPQGV